MECRAHERTGVHVWKLSLGTMMSGAWCNPDCEDSIRRSRRDEFVVAEQS